MLSPASRAPHHTTHIKKLIIHAEVAQFLSHSPDNERIEYPSHSPLGLFIDIPKLLTVDTQYPQGKLN